MAFKATNRELTEAEKSAAKARRARLVKQSGGKPPRPAIAAAQLASEPKAQPAQPVDIVPIGDWGGKDEDDPGGAQDCAVVEIDPMGFLDDEPPDVPTRWSAPPQPSKIDTPHTEAVAEIQEAVAAAVDIPTESPAIAPEIASSPTESLELPPAYSSEEQHALATLLPPQSGIMFNARAKSPFSNFMTKVL